MPVPAPYPRQSHFNPISQLEEAGLDDQDAASAPGTRELSTPEGYLAALSRLAAGDLAAEPCLRGVVRAELYQ